VDDDPRSERREPSELALEALRPEDGELLANLLELYIHDLSAIFTRVELDARGRFGYPPLSAYLSGRTDRFAFLIRCGGRVAGFALAKRGSPVSADPNALDIAEFFVLRRFREHGVGRAAAALLWDRLPGTWTIRALVANTGAVSFWRRAVAAYTRGSGTEREHLDGTSSWLVFSFDNTGYGIGGAVHG
jgi:predicted acetyltransferase